MSGTSPTALTLRELRADGWLAEVVERWVPGANVRRDLFGGFDVLAIKNGTTLAVQVTTSDHVAARVRKIAELPHIGTIREAGWQLEVHGWHKDGRRWTVRKVDVS
ncbi:MAG: hypothetical protein AB7R77_05940 [Ilumatobacteraceae bacterium]